MDIARLQPSIAGLTDAQAAYETALRDVADATRRAAQQPLDADATTRLQLASEELAEARTRVESARQQLDANRLLELAQLATGDQLLGSIDGRQVLSLFPVAIEARLEPGRLRMRVWPDAISTSTHDPRLTEKELAAAKRYWREEAAATTDDASRDAWRALSDEIGPTRAAWAAQVLTPTNRDALQPGVDPVFPIVPMQDDAAPFVPRAGVLPDRWIAIGIRDNVRVVEHVGAPIPMDLAVGIDTTPAETVALANREGEPIQLPPRMRWMTDFAIGVEVGMALDIPVGANVDRLDELFVFGVRITQTPAQNAAALEDLFTGHRFSRGFAFVPQNTPTNNSVAGGSGLPSRGQRVDAAFNLERRPRAFVPGAASNGVSAARAFGLETNVFAAIPASGAAPGIAAEPDGFEPEAAAAMQTMLWQVTLGAALEDFLLLPNARADALREYFRQHVRAAGPVPALRVGRQPYGVLPVTAINAFIDSGDGIDPRLLPVLRASRSWFASLRQGDLFNGASEDALRHLGRSLRLFAETTRQSSSFTGANRWATLAASLAIASGNTIPNTWRNRRITGTVEGIPAPVARPIVDEAAAPDMAALASGLPGAILELPEPASVLGRIARHAALLEWSRFARGACEVIVDEASNVDLATRAARLGSDVYTRVLIQAFADRLEPIGPVGPAPIDPVIRRSLREDARRREDGEIPDLPEPEDPEEPRPDRPPLEGEREVTLEERRRIRALVGSLTQPLATCPGAARLASFRQALAQLARFPAARLEYEMFGALDICNHRLDAWFTSLASRRLATLRAAAPAGVVIGGWGCLQDVRGADPLDPQQRAEFIHTPSLDQAAAAAVLRSGARRARRGGSSHGDIDLSSRRVRLARWILEGVRNGRSLNELLGARFEREVKGTPAEAQLGELRALFPGVSGAGVLDGLALQQSTLPPSSSPDAIRGAAALDETLDAVADAVTAEAVYQIVRGNPVGALINIEAIAAGAAPPDLHVTETPASGIRLTHRIVIALPAKAAAPGWPVGSTPRSRAEPLLDAWCGLLLGPADKTILTIEGAAGTVRVPLSLLRIGAIDVVLAGRNRGAELAEAAIRAAAEAAAPAGPALTEPRVREDRAWKDLVGLCDATAAVLTQGEALRAESFDPPSAVPPAAAADVGDLPVRVNDALAELTAVRDALVQRTAPVASVIRAAAFGVRLPGVLPGATPSTEQQDALLAAVEARVTAAMTGTPRERLRALFGGDLPGIVTFTPRDPEMLVTATSPPPSLLDGDAAAPHTWLDAAGRNHSKAAALAEVLLRKEAAGDTAPVQLLIAQAPWTDGDRWIATSFTSRSKRQPAGRLSVLIHAPAGFSATEPLGGLLIDGWTETIPAASRDTAMALRFNNASTRAPQVILLAVSPNPAQPWSTTTLVDVLRDTLMLARLRVQPSTSFSRGGLMPFAWLGQRATNTGISFSI